MTPFKIFLKRRFALPNCTRAFFVHRAAVLRLEEEICESHGDTQVAFPFENFFVESEDIGFYWYKKDDLPQCVAIDMKREYHLPVADLATATHEQIMAECDRGRGREFVLAMDALLAVHHITRSVTHHAREAAELLPDRPVIAIRRGDTFRYDIVKAADYAKTARHLREIIRRRDHAVRGHWRKLSSGQLTWVRDHRRGDPALGTVTTAQEIGNV